MNTKRKPFIFMLIWLTTVIVLLLLTGCVSTHTPYVKIGVGYKVQETELYFKDKRANDPVSARIDVGLETGNITYGVSHHSQWFSGFPVNNDSEYYKTELFVDYKLSF